MPRLLKFAQKIIDKRDNTHIKGIAANRHELKKQPLRTDIINLLIADITEPEYLEIGVRNPDHNFNHVRSQKKYSVDPGVEFKDNPVDFKLTSDAFFDGLKKGEYLKNTLFDVIFIDGLHTAEQVNRDIENALSFIKDDGFLVLHDCNPPTEWHAREHYEYMRTPARKCWNGTTWKAYAKAIKRKDLSGCCIDTDWGVGVISKTKKLGEPSEIDNPFWEYRVMEENRKESLNLVSFDEFKALLNT